MKKILDKISIRLISVITVFLFLMSMLPNWYLAFIARPAGDDYGYSAASHQVWLQTHSLIEVIKTGIETTKSMCMSWNGDWFSVFLFTLMPEVFVNRSFWIVPLFWSIATIFATYYFLYQLLTRWLGFKNYITVMITGVVMLISYQWVPSSGIAFYWYVGVIHYVMPHVIALILLGFLVRYIQTGKMKYMVYSALGMIAIGGSSYYAAFLVFFAYILVISCGMKKSRKLGWIFLPLFTGIVALYLQVTAPGNEARVGESIGFTIQKAVETIWGALTQGIVSIAGYMSDSPFIILLLLLIAIILWMGLLQVDTKFQFRYPLLFAGYLYGVYAATFTPEIYAATEISGGPPTMEFWTFILTSVLVIGYTEGWILTFLRKRLHLKDTEWCHLHVLLPYVVFFLLAIIVWKSELKETLFYESVEYIASGKAADYKQQMDSQLEILLDDSIKEAYLCPTNDEQGPLMHMPIIENPDAFTNRVVAQFYGKEKVTTQSENP